MIPIADINVYEIENHMHTICNKYPNFRCLPQKKNIFFSTVWRETIDRVKAQKAPKIDRKREWVKGAKRKKNYPF